MTTLPDPEDSEKAFCSLCRRLFVIDELVWSSKQQGVVCPDCLAENQSCGCEDV